MLHAYYQNSSSATKKAIDYKKGTISILIKCNFFLQNKFFLNRSLPNVFSYLCKYIIIFEFSVKFCTRCD